MAYTIVFVTILKQPYAFCVPKSTSERVGMSKHPKITCCSFLSIKNILSTTVWAVSQSSWGCAYTEITLRPARLLEIPSLVSVFKGDCYRPADGSASLMFTWIVQHRSQGFNSQNDFKLISESVAFPDKVQICVKNQSCYYTYNRGYFSGEPVSCKKKSLCSSSLLKKIKITLFLTFCMICHNGKCSLFLVCVSVDEFNVSMAVIAEASPILRWGLPFSLSVVRQLFKSL